MSEPDVGRTLREIRERVRVQLRTQANLSQVQNGEPSNTVENAFESLRANLSVIERSRNKLPPILSYRQGWVARLELSIKRLLKKVTHWFTWEQVNFNAATFNALQEILVVLSAQREVLSELQAQLDKVAALNAEMDARRSPNIWSGDSQKLSTSQNVMNISSPGQNNEKHDVDMEIQKLAARLEELRAARAKTNS